MGNLTVTERREYAVKLFFDRHGPTMRAQVTHAFIRNPRRAGLKWSTKILRQTMLRMEQRGELKREMTSPRNGKPGELWSLA